jgi:Asp-tRNA(Asn)/Glu-tRNA(Gln) amidotransferase A subunit family amidase/pimeloyl-ACP methyl ester carboxylesterase
MEASNTPRLRELDFAPFAEELAAFTPERAAEIDTIVKDADIAQVQDAVKAGQLTYAELTLYFLARIQQVDDTLRTMIELNPDALKEAQAADQRLQAGEAAGLMFGMPVTLKDNIETTAPLHTAGGSEILLNHVPDADASFVQQLRAAGAVILGKSNLSELAGGITIIPPGASAVGGVTMNPHGEFSAGGSSSGSGAGTAAYLTMASVGSETAGSLIVPASWNGVVGMYPGRGVVDGANVIPLIKNNDSAGPIGRHVADVATLLGVIDTLDVDYVAGLDAAALDGVNAGLLKTDVLRPASALEDTADNAAIAQLIETSLANAGATVTAIELTPAGIGGQIDVGLMVMINGGVRHDMTPYLVAAGAPIATLEDLAAYNLAEPDTRIPFGQSTIDAALADTITQQEDSYQAAVAEIKAAATAALDTAFAESSADVLVSVNNYHSSLYATANYPAISVPLGLRANGMPVGVVLIGKPGEEAKLLSYAYALEQATKLRVDPDLDATLAQEQTIPQAVSGKVVPCPMPLPASEIEGETIICGEIQVPENWDDPNSRLLTLTYARLLSKNLSHIADPVLYFFGGPGGSILSFQGAPGANFPYLRETRDVIVWDQRGNRYSADLRCPIEVMAGDPAATQATQDALAALGDANFTLASDPEAVLDYARQKQKIIGLAGRCAAYFAEQGVDLTQYNTANTVRDSIALMDHLGDPAYNLLGISYGTQVALAVADYYEKNPKAALPPVRSIVIDGVFPINVSKAEEQLETPYNTLRVFADCEADAACGAAYPDIRQTLIDLLAKLERAPLKTASGAEVTLDDLRGVLFTAVQTRNVPLITYLPRMVDELARGETDTYDVARALIAGKIQPPAPAVPAANVLDPVKVETNALAEELRDIAGRLDTLGDTTGDLAQAIEEANTLPELYVNVLYRYLERIDPDARGTYANTVATYKLRPEQQTRQGLVNLAQSLHKEVAGELTAIANQLSDVEAAVVWDSLTDDSALQRLRYLDFITYAVVNCNDRSSTMKTGPGMELLRNFDAPQLVTNFLRLATDEADCELYGLAVPDYAIPPAVKTDLPVLVMNGSLDPSTPEEWGKAAFKTLTNARIVTVPMAGHGTTGESKCAQDIAHTFFLYPDAKLDTSCVETFRPVFVLPGDDLPQIPAE